MRRAFLLAALLALAVPVAASAAVRLRGVNAAGFPTVRATVVTSTPSAQPPYVTENGLPVVGLTAENLGRAKSLVVAIDRSRSMAGRPLGDAVAAARAFVAAKTGGDRVQITAFGSRAVALTRFSSATIDADTALRTMPLDSRRGTALYDAVESSANALATEPGRGRVIVLLTDGQDVSSTATEAAAIAAARAAGAVVYPIALGSSQASQRPLHELAEATGGTYYGAVSTATLKQIYAAIAAELKRTWRLEYVTAARPGDQLRLQAIVGPERSSAELTVPADLGGGPVPTPKPSPLLPGPAYSPAGGFILALAIALLVLGACGFVLAAKQGSWIKTRIAAHVEPSRLAKKRDEKRERLAFLAGLFRATERAFGHRRQWQRLQRMLERSDVPLRTVEFAYLVTGCGLLFGLLAAFAGLSSLMILLAFVVGGLVPYGWVWYKARSRTTAFDDQLPDLLVTLAASLKAGHSFKQGIQTVVDEGQEPASKELKRVLTETRLGRPMDEALGETADRIGSKNFSFVITAVTIQRQVGGSLAGLFDMVADTVRQRQQFARKIRSLTAMGRASAYVLVGLPFFVGLAITLLNPTYMDPLYHSSTGHMLIFIGLGMIAFGSAILKKIVSFKG